MRSKAIRLSVQALTISFVLLPYIVLAATAPAVDVPVTLANPLGATTDPRLIIANIIKAILSIIGSLALLMFVVGGVTWITSFGEASRVERGKQILIWATLGLVVIASAYVLVNAVVNGLVFGSVTGAT